MTKRLKITFLTHAILMAQVLATAQAGQITVNASSNSYWIANEGQWEGDFSFKCEVGSAVYYVTPKGMTVDFREYTRHERPRDPNDPLDAPLSPSPFPVNGERGTPESEVYPIFWTISCVAIDGVWGFDFV